MVRRMAVLLIGLIAGGCATLPDVQLDALKSAKLCCESFKDMPVGRALTDETILEFTPASPVFLFEQGRSYFSVVTLPFHARGKAMTLRTFGAQSPFTRTGEYWPYFAYFFPAVTFLNDFRDPISVANDEVLVPQLHGWSGHITMYRRIRIPDTASYAVVHSVERKIGQTQIEYLQGSAFLAPAGGLLIPMGGGNNRVPAVFSATGKVGLSVE